MFLCLLEYNLSGFTSATKMVANATEFPIVGLKEISICTSVTIWPANNLTASDRTNQSHRRAPPPPDWLQGHVSSSARDGADFGMNCEDKARPVWVSAMFWHGTTNVPVLGRPSSAFGRAQPHEKEESFTRVKIPWTLIFDRHFGFRSSCTTKCTKDEFFNSIRLVLFSRLSQSTDLHHSITFFSPVWKIKPWWWFIKFISWNSWQSFYISA